eukprot:GHVH01008782.1.p1 GENE.GHVH01008782.1~~GHVH01008782.1.p1  ORF type:complete len:546 (+),score=86.10 GHVH01008782.1:183-1820(+)
MSSKKKESASHLDNIRLMISQVITNDQVFSSSVKLSFEQFDVDGSGTLDFQECQQLIAKLSANLQIPAPPEDALKQIFKIYDENRNGCLNLEQFSRLYKTLLERIKEKYYPERTVYIDRSAFISRTTLDTDISRRLKFTKTLGSGQFGQAHLVVERVSNIQRVCKQISKEHVRMRDLWDAEIEVMKRLDHQNVIKVYEVYEDKKNLCIIMEACSGGELQDTIVSAKQRRKRLSEVFICDVMRQLLSAVNYFHKRNVAHRDLKPANILFLNNEPDSLVKVIDFGLAEIFQYAGETSAYMKGTGLYWSPEVFLMKAGLKSDIWSCGVILWNLLTEGAMPFFATSKEELQAKVASCEPNWRQVEHASTDAKNLLRWMLTKDYSKRASAKACLLHPWIQSSLKSVRSIAVPNVIMTNMIKFTKMSAVKRAIVLMMAHQLNTNGTQVKAITQLYLALDRKGAGLLDLDEFCNGLTGLGIPKFECNRIFQSIDLDGSNAISYTEFLAACYTWRQSDQNIMRAAFFKVDRMNNGFVTIEEFVTASGFLSSSG